MTKFAWLGVALAVGAASSAQALTVTPTASGTTLANAILGSGVTISSATYTGTATASGTFTGGLSTGIGIDTGIILTTGNAVDAVGPNTSDSTTVNNPDAAFPIPGNDAAVLEIKFTTTTGSLFFNYVFASEEYNEFTNSSFNDKFWFLLDGTTAAQNIALIPGTNTPVSINTVNGGNPLGTNATNSQFFNNNDLTDGGPFFNIAYDGFTDIFTASATGLAADVEHTILLAILDTSDSALDSAVFIQGGTFGGEPPPPPNAIPLPAGMPLLLGAMGVLAYLRRKQ